MTLGAELVSWVVRNLLQRIRNASQIHGLNEDAPFAVATPGTISS